MIYCIVLNIARNINKGYWNIVTSSYTNDGLKLLICYLCYLQHQDSLLLSDDAYLQCNQTCNKSACLIATTLVR